MRPNWKSSLWWAALILGLIALWVTLQPITEADFWWHMRIGAWIQAQGQIPTRGLFSATQADSAFFYQSWGSEWLYAWLYQLGGLALIHLMRGLLVIGTYGLLAWHTQRRTNNGRATAVGVLLAASMAFTNWAVRPQMFSMPLFMGMLLVLTAVASERWSRRWLLVVPLFEVLWVNLHGAFILGPVLAGATAVGAWLDRRRDHVEAPTYPTLKALWWTVAGTTAALLVNPRGVGVIGYVWNLLTNPGSQELISEWRSPLSKLDQPTNQFFVLVLLISLIMIGVIWSKLRSADLLLYGGFALLALTGIRYTIWFGMIAGALTAEAIIRRNRLKLTKRSGEPTGLIAVVACVLLLLVLLVQAPWRGLLPLSGSLTPRNTPIARADLVHPDTPLAAAEYLLAHPPSGNLLNSEVDGSYLIWRIGEQIPVFVDTRIELYPLEQWNDYLCMAHGEDWPQLFERYNITTALLNNTKHAQLIEQLDQAANWQAAYSDDRFTIFERSGAASNTSPPCTRAAN